VNIESFMSLKYRVSYQGPHTARLPTLLQPQRASPTLSYALLYRAAVQFLVPCALIRLSWKV
jgi:hypothetical protein